MKGSELNTENQDRSTGCSNSLKGELKKGWLQIVAVFGANMFAVGYGKSFGVIYIILLEIYGSSATATGWMSGLQTLLQMALGPVSSMLIKRWSVRPVCLVGACILTTGAICSSFANSLVVMYITYGVMIGLGSCVVYVGNYLVIATNFEKHRMFAYGFSNVGYSLGIFLFPILSDILIENYSFKGYLLIFGGILANTIVCTALFRTNKQNSENLPESDSLKTETGSLVHAKVQLPNSLKAVSLPEISTKYDDENTKLYKENRWTSSYQLDMYSKSMLYSEIPSDKQLSQNMSGYQDNLDVNRPLAAQSVIKPKICVQCLSYRVLMSNPLFVNLCIDIICQTMTFGAFYAFMKALAIENQIESEKATFLLSLSGLADLLGNLILSPIADLTIVKPRRILLYAILTFIYGIGFSLFPFAKTFLTMIFLVGFSVFISSQAHTARLAVALDIVQSSNADEMSDVIGIMTFCMGTGHALGPAIGGLLVDSSGGYALAFHVIGLCLAAASFILGLLTVFCKT